MARYSSQGESNIVLLSEDRAQLQFNSAQICYKIRLK